jgi:hypothetical protein
MGGERGRGREMEADERVSEAGKTWVKAGGRQGRAGSHRRADPSLCLGARRALRARTPAGAEFAPESAPVGPPGRRADRRVAGRASPRQSLPSESAPSESA